MIHTEYAKQDQNQIPIMDSKIMEYIRKYEEPYYDQLLSGENEFQVWYQLSSLRTGLLGWYPFGKDAHVLEIGAGFGALTGMLCDRCGHVTATERALHRARALAERWKDKENLDVYAGEWSEMDFQPVFDYVILTGILERVCKGSSRKEDYAEYLRKVSLLLKDGGKILFAVDNRLGLKFFCGAKEPHTNRAFDGLNGYPAGTRGYSFTRRELEEILELTGMEPGKFYYPLPDYKFVQMVYTDSYLPDKSLKERLIPYYVDKNALVVWEEKLYDDILEQGMFPAMANSFLVECGRRTGAKGREVVYAAVSTDRGIGKSFATVIYADRTVEKRALFPQGQNNVKALWDKLEELRESNVPVLPYRMEAESLWMPYMELPTLSNYMKALAGSRPERIVEILERLYEYILLSSRQVEPVRNAMTEHLWPRLEEAGQAAISREDFGPVLERAYIELIPLNCFYEEKDDAYFFFDQEYVREGYPAKYVLFRAIWYIYIFTPGLEGVFPQEKVKEHFGMEALWPYFVKEEMLFLDEVRNRDTYRPFYQWAAVDNALIQKNIEKLKSEEEKIADYRVSDKMKKIWKVELQMLDLVDAICSRHHLKYFIVHGTLLGAVRHKGFIPWDDDLDIGMLREDYDRFLEVAAKELDPPYVLQNMWTEEDCFFGGHSRIRNADTTGIQAGDLGHRGCQGIWIDILPLDNCTADEKRLQHKEKKINKAYALLYAQVYGKQVKGFGGLGRLGWWLCRMEAAVTSHKRLCGRLERAVRLYTEEEAGSRDVSVFTGYGQHRHLNKADFQDVVLLDFAGRRVPAPEGYGNYLFMILGRDYMKYPPEEERKPKHTGIFDPEKPYTAYLDKFAGMFEDVKGKEIILFGAGLMFEDYMKHFGGRYRPAFLVDNDENKWGRQRMGMEIRPPQAILEVPEQKRRIIICSYYYKEIQKQLEEMGIADYTVYVQKLEWVLKAEE